MFAFLHTMWLRILPFRPIRPSIKKRECSRRTCTRDLVWPHRDHQRVTTEVSAAAPSNDDATSADRLNGSFLVIGLPSSQHSPSHHHHIDLLCHPEKWWAGGSGRQKDDGDEDGMVFLGYWMPFKFYVQFCAAVAAAYPKLKSLIFPLHKVIF